MKPKIVIVGQKPRRREELERAFAARARLTFFNDGNPHQLKAQVRHAAAVFVMIDASDHKTIAAIQRVGGQPRYVPGATSTLKDALDEYLTGLGC